jgi:GNAT superfamily N-acetyltransferase
MNLEFLPQVIKTEAEELSIASSQETIVTWRLDFVMDNIKVLVVSENELTDQQRLGIGNLERQCFSDVDPKEAEECFYAKSFGRILAYSDDRLVGHLMLIRRNIEFDGRKVSLGGVAGACVTENMRGKGIATKMIKKGLEVLRKEKCDVACLNVDLSKKAYKLYEKLWFRLMNRKISFEDIHGNIRCDNGTMFIPICSEEIYNYIMRSDKIFHYGEGYW